MVISSKYLSIMWQKALEWEATKEVREQRRREKEEKQLKCIQKSLTIIKWATQ